MIVRTPQKIHIQFQVTTFSDVLLHYAALVCKSVRQMELLNGLCGYVCEVMVKVKGAILPMDSGQGVSSLT